MEQRIPPQGRTICRFCGSSLAASGAWKCVHCSEHQTWVLQVLPRIGLSDLALLVAVGSLAWIAVQNLVRGESATLDLKILECTRSQISIAVFNSGSQPGILSSLRVAVVDATAADVAVVGANTADVSEVKDSYLLSKDKNGQQVGPVQVDPGKSVLLAYQVDSSVKNHFRQDCALRILANKYEESKPQSRPIDRAACTCKEVI